MEELLAEQEGGHSEGQKKRLAFLDMLLCATTGPQKLSYQDIREEVDTFMFEVCNIYCGLFVGFRFHLSDLI